MKERESRIDLRAWESDAAEAMAKWGNRAHYLGMHCEDPLLEWLAEDIEEVMRQFARRCGELRERAEGRR